MSDFITSTVNTETATSEPVEVSTYAPPPSQADFDRIIESRLTQERKKYADYEQLKSQSVEYEKYLESQKSEHQKALDKTRNEVENEVSKKFINRLVHAEVKTVAAFMGFHNPDDAILAIGDDLPVVDDAPDTATIKKMLDEFVKSRPYMIQTPGAGKPARTIPKPSEGERLDKTLPNSKNNVAAALRQLAASRKTQ